MEETNKNIKKYGTPAEIPGVSGDDRPQPHDLNSEKAVIAAMLLEPKPCVDIAVEKLGSGDVFYSPAYRAVFKCVTELYESESGVDIISVANALEKAGRLEQIGGELFLAETQNSIATTANIETWCAIVREYSILREMINICVQAVEKCFNPEESVDELIGQIEADIFNVRYNHVQSEIVEFKKHIEETFRYVNKIIRKEVEVGIPSQYPDLDSLIIGLKPGEMVVLAARPSIGKTSFALNIVRNVALKGGKGTPVAFFSLEMTAEQLARRMLCTEAGIPETSFYNGEFTKSGDITKLTGAVETLRSANIFIDPTSGITISELTAKARRLKAKHDIQLVVIDYLQLMKAGGRVDSRQQEVAEISSGIKKLAKDLNIPVLVLAQLNREIEKTTGKSSRPKLSHLRESGAIEQDADIVMFLHRDRDETKDITLEAQINGVESLLIVEKNRNGGTGLVELSFHPQTMEFRSKSRYSEEFEPEQATPRNRT
jgi:replicative DNA helicase